MSKIRVNANPTKDFFVNMMTRDISLEDCILDLLDNCLDGAHRVRTSEDSYEGFQVDLKGDETSLTINDNCGGIDIDLARDYAFRFGRPKESQPDTAIGLYGIGMKRAFFRIGKTVTVESHTKDNAFILVLDVEDWLVANEKDWSFEMEEIPAKQKTGTKIKIEDIHESVAIDFSDKVFWNELAEIISRDYAFFLLDGFTIKLDKTKIQPYEYRLKESEDLVPLNTEYEDESGVQVSIRAGLFTELDDDSDPDASSSAAARSGWYVSCNDRIVLASDRTGETVWGDGTGKRRWHPQYNGFMGIVNFKSENPNLLPWDTTKRQIDAQNPVYKRALPIMNEHTKTITAYTGKRRTNLDEAKAVEKSAPLTPVRELKKSASVKMPKISSTKRRTVTVNFQEPKDRVDRAKAEFEVTSNSEAGKRAFNYFYQNEIEDE